MYARGPALHALPAADSAFDESLLNDEMPGLAVTALGKAAVFEHLAQFFEHRGTAAHHDPVLGDIERRLADIVEQLRGSDEVGGAAAIAERLAGDGRIIDELFFQQRSE